MDKLTVWLDERDLRAYQQAYWHRQATELLLEHMRRANTKPCVRTMRRYRQYVRQMRNMLDEIRAKYVPGEYQSEGYEFYINTETGTMVIYEARRGAKNEQI